MFNSYIENLEKRNNHAIDSDAYHIDHIISSFDGFKNGILPAIIGDIVNLRCVPCKQNLKKQKRSEGSIEKLIESYESRELHPLE